MRKKRMGLTGLTHGSNKSTKKAEPNSMVGDTGFEPVTSAMICQRFDDLDAGTSSNLLQYW